MKRFLSRWCVLSLWSIAVGCSPLHFAESLLLRNHYELIRNLAYGPGTRQRLDVYRPREGRTAAPVVVFIYGGRWQDGSKEQYHLLGDALTRRGLVAVVPDYRLYPEVRFPGWVDDAARVVRWVSDSIQRFGGDPERIFVVGHSSGAHTAALLALDERYLRQAGVPASSVLGFVSLAGPVATVWTDRDVQTLMGPREGWPETYPLEHVDGSEPPLLLLHGGRDKVVDPANSTVLAARIQGRGGCARAIIYPGLNHVGIVLAFMVPRLGITAIFEEVLRFVQNPRAVTCPDRSEKVEMAR